MPLRFRITALLLTLSIAPASHAILLDCEVSDKGIYTCVEIIGAPDSPSGIRASSEVREQDRPYLEQAQQECVYRKPRLPGGKARSNPSIVLEFRKAAQEEYDLCVRNRARELKYADDPQ